jgi:hypothetical protein
MIDFTEQEFEEVRMKGEELYNSLEDVHCPYFNEKISFTPEGLDHLAFRSGSRYRSVKDQYMRFKLLHLVPEILKLSRTLQGIREVRKFERVRIHSRTENVLKLVKYYQFIAVLGRHRLMVIVKQIENGAKFFWSIIPFWGMNKETMSRMLFEGNPEND